MDEKHRDNWVKDKVGMDEAYKNWVSQCDVPTGEQTQINFLWWAVFHLLESEAKRVAINQALSSQIEDLIQFGSLDPSKVT